MFKLHYDTPVPTISGRDLWKKFKVKYSYTCWVRNKVHNGKYVEGRDYYEVHLADWNKYQKLDHRFTIDAVKRICHKRSTPIYAKILREIQDIELQRTTRAKDRGLDVKMPAVCFTGNMQSTVITRKQYNMMMECLRTAATAITEMGRQLEAVKNENAMLKKDSIIYADYKNLNY